MQLPISLDITLSDKEYHMFTELVYKLSGIDLGENKRELVKARLMKRIREFGFGSFAEYYQFVVNDKSHKELECLLNAISTNVTSFFREKQHFEYLTKVSLPQIMAVKKKQHNQNLRIWSCAASSGEEIYTILMTVINMLDRHVCEWDIKVLGTDISTNALNLARQACYEAARVREIPAAFLEKFFNKELKDGVTYYRIQDFVRQMAYFARLNLMDQTFPFKGKFDVIFCRNVMIYFNKPTQTVLVNKLYNYLNPGGYLFIGHSESLLGMQTQFRSVTPAGFQKPLG